MELTWITFPTIVVTVSLLAYYAAYAAQGERPAGQQGGRRGYRPGGRPGARQHVGQPVQPAEPRLHDPDHSRCRWIATPPPAAASVRRPAGPAAGRNGSRDELVQRPGGPVWRHGQLRPAVQLRRQRLHLPAHVGSRVAGERPHSDLEHEMRHIPLVRSGRAPGRLRLAAGGDRPRWPGP